LVEAFPLKKSAHEALHFDYDAYKEAHLTPGERLVIIVFFAAERACPLAAILVRDALKGFEALSVKDV
jgi:hypothetical protein